MHCFHFIILRTTRLHTGAKLYRKFAAGVQLIIIVLKWNKNLITLQVYSQVSLSPPPPLCLAARPQWGPQIQKRLRHTMHTHSDCLAMASGAEKVWVFSKNNPCVCVSACMCVRAYVYGRLTCLTDDSKKTQNLPKTTRRYSPLRHGMHTVKAAAGWLLRYTDKGLTWLHVCCSRVSAAKHGYMHARVRVIIWANTFPTTQNKFKTLQTCTRPGNMSVELKSMENSAGVCMCLEMRVRLPTGCYFLIGRG